MLKKSKKPRILFISSELVTGGAAMLTLNWIDFLRNDFDIDLLICGPTDERMVSILPLDVTFYHLPRLANWKNFLKNSIRPTFDNLRHLLAKRQIPIIECRYHAVIATSIFWSREACMLYSLLHAERKICFLVDEVLLGKLGQKYRSIHEMAVLATDNFISVSESLWGKVSQLALFEGCAPTKILWPPVRLKNQEWQNDTDCIELKKDKPILITIARLDEVKGIAESLDIHHNLKAIGVDFRWYILGDGPQKNFLQDRVKQLNMQDDFFLVGHISNVWSWLKQADLFVLLSKSEGCPTVILEALHAKLPVLAADVGGVRELLEGGNLGVIVSSDPDDIKTNLAALIKNKNLRHGFKERIAMSASLDKSLRDRNLLKKLLNEDSISANESVTILIPTYNQANFIYDAITSALNQDYEHLNVVVVDDASSDKTEEICRQWLHHPRFNYVKNITNLGRVKNYHQSLLFHATGKWVLMLDGDDYLTDLNFVSSALKKLHSYKNRDIAFIQAGHKALDIRYSKNKDIRPNLLNETCLMMPGEYLKFLLDTGFFSHLGMIYRRDLILTDDLYTKDISSSDMEAFLRASLAHPVVVFDHIAGVWRRHDQNGSCNVDTDSIAENLTMLNPIVREAKMNGLVGKTIAKSLLHYQTSSLCHLFREALRKSIKNPLMALKLYPIAWSINPIIILHPKIHKLAIKSFFKLLVAK